MRLLRLALASTFVLHGVAMLAMAALLLPMMPGGPTADDSARMVLIAEHPWRFRIAWWPWHLTALSDLLLAWALWRAPTVPRLAATVTGGLTVLAVLADQGGQLLWVTRGVALARHGNLDRYLELEQLAFPLTAKLAAVLYTLAAIGWCVCFARARLWSRALTVLSLVLWPLFLLVTVGPFPPRVLAAGNAAGFLLMELWFLLVLFRVRNEA